MSDYDEEEDYFFEDEEPASGSDTESKRYYSSDEPGEGRKGKKGEKSKRLSDTEQEDLYTGKLNPSDYARTGGIASENIGTTSGSGRFGDPYNSYLSQIYIKINETDYPQKSLDEAVFFSKKIPKNNIMLLNVDVLVPALIYMTYHSSEKNFTAANIEDFLKNYKTLNPFDFVRYIRHLSLLLKM